MDPGCTPQWVLLAHPPNQITQAAIDPRQTRGGPYIRKGQDKPERGSIVR